MTTTTIQRTVLRRIRIIRAIETVSSPAVLAPALMLVLLWGVGKEVWVARVLDNVSSVHTPEQLVTFALSAFINTRAVVQVLSVMLIAVGGWFIYGIHKLLAERGEYQLG